MTPGSEQARALTEQIIAALDGTLDEPGRLELARRVSEDPAVQEFYVQQMAIHALLRRSHGFMASLAVTDPSSPVALGAGGFRDTVAQDLQDLSIRDVLNRAATEPADDSMPATSGRGRGGTGRISWPTLLARMAAVVLLCLAVLWFDRWLIRSVPAPKGNVQVARLTRTCRARWAGVGPAGTLDEGIALMNRTYQLQEGWAQITMGQGAVVLLQAPAAIELEGANRVYLHRGALTARVGPEAHGFTVRSRRFCLVDYGTEFGIQITDSDAVETHVFDGQVDLRSGDNPLVFEQARRITAGQAARAERDGRVTVVPLEQRPRLFVRRLPDADQAAVAGRTIDLADIIGQGTGLGTGHAGWAVDPLTGTSGPKPRFVSGEPDPSDPGVAPSRTQLSRTRLVPVTDNPFIDCVVTPCGDGPVPITTQGHVWFDAPESDGTVFQQITNTNPITQLLSLDGVVYGNPARPGFYMHAATGLTFDLAALRRTLGGLTLERFQARFGINDNQNPSGRVGLVVLVDGRQRFELEGELRGAHPVSVPLGPEDRFLTLFVTEGGDGPGGDRCVFGEPVLVVRPQN